MSQTWRGARLRCTAMLALAAQGEPGWRMNCFACIAFKYKPMQSLATTCLCKARTHPYHHKHVQSEDWLPALHPVRVHCSAWLDSVPACFLQAGSAQSGQQQLLAQTLNPGR